MGKKTYAAEWERLEERRADIESGALLVDTWEVADVKHVAKERDHGKITKAQAILALRVAKKKFDANNGINWDTLSYALDIALEELS